MALEQSARDQLTDLNRRFSKAELERDRAFFERVLAPSLQFRRASGKQVDLATFLADLEAPTKRYLFNHTEDIELVDGGDIVLVAARVWVRIIVNEGTDKEQQVTGLYRNCRVWHRKPVSADGWVCALWFNEQVG